MRLIGLDVGEKRTGVSRVDTSVKIAVPFGVIEMNNTKFTEIRRVADFYNAEIIVVGLPRNSSGLETAQSQFVRNFAKELKSKHEKFKIVFQDETLTSVEAEKRLKSRGKPYEKADIDSEAATIILQDFIDSCIDKSHTTGVNIEEVIASTTKKSRNSAKTSKPPVILPSAVKFTPAVKEYNTPPTNLASTSVKYSQNLASFDSHGAIKIPKTTKNVGTVPKPQKNSPAPASVKVPTPEKTTRLKNPVSSEKTTKKSPKPTLSAKISAKTTKLKKNLQVTKIKVKSKLQRQPKSAKILEKSKPQSIPKKPQSTPSRQAIKKPVFLKKLPINSLKSLKPRYFIIGISILTPITIAFFAFLWYNGNISAISSKTACEKYTPLCTKSDFKINIGDTADTIATNLEKAKIIKNKSAFKLFLKLNRRGGNFKAGLHPLTSAMNVAEIVAELEKTNSASVFSLTILPGETIFDIKAKFLKLGYGTLEITEAFKKQYNHPILSDKPKDASLEGYLFAETYEFFKDETLENVITRLLDETNKFVNQNDLRNKYAARGLNLHQGLTLASIIQKETKKDHAIIAQIFEKRFKQNDKLGSDVTVTYAVDLVDPTRQIYKNNAEKLEINSPYNTRKYAGLPPTPISAPGADALNAVANPANTDYFYFLTGDDGKMYYSKTDAEHNYNIRQFCQKLCTVGL